MKKYILLFILFIPFIASAKEATNISCSSIYFINNKPISELNDESYDTYYTLNTTDTLTIKTAANIEYIYIMYEINSVKGMLSSETQNIELGKDGYLHEFIELNNNDRVVNLKYDSTVTISEIRLYTDGDIPKDVQIWEKDTTTDLMLFSTHSDDEVLFFGGILPTYINQGKKVHVVYLTTHVNCKKPKQIRLHEVLDGLWTSGVRDYPTFGILPDERSNIAKNDQKSYDKIIKKVKKQVENDKLTEETLINFYVKTIRKYQPTVILGHDIYGEYGHGQHIYNTYLLKKAILKTKDKLYITGTLKTYNVPKVYLHLYNIDNPTIIDLDTPLSNYDNKTAYQVTKEAFKKHISQQSSRYPAWLNGPNNEYTEANDIPNYNPMYWGLYYSTVGVDKLKNDLFEIGRAHV